MFNLQSVSAVCPFTNRPWAAGPVSKRKWKVLRQDGTQLAVVVGCKFVVSHCCT